jgi:transposase InsO family protein
VTAFPTGDRPGERRAFRVDRSERRFPAIATSFNRVLRRSVETKQDASGDYITRLEAHGIQPSTSRIACRWDNAQAESFMKTLKQEEVDGRSYHTIGEAKSASGSFIDDVYYTHRLHSALNYQAPVVFEAHNQLCLIFVSQAWGAVQWRCSDFPPPSLLCWLGSTSRSTRSA